MKKNILKKWTVLIYANGNNELEPEMCQSMLSAEDFGSTEDINIVVQLSRIDRRAVSILRPLDLFEDIDNNWAGVRRYYVEHKHHGHSKKFSSKLLQDLGKTNMAHPKSLYDFISWGITNYPSEHYMLVLGGHSFLYIGAMADYTQDFPYIMGIPEMSKVISDIRKNLKKNIDLLVLDSCNMNFVEILYELCKDKNNCVKTVITYIKDGPLGGMSYNKLLRILQANLAKTDLKILIKDIVDKMNLDLVAIELNHRKMSHIKNLCHQLGGYYVDILQNQSGNDSKIESSINPLIYKNEFTKALNKATQSIVIHSKRVESQGKSGLLNIGVDLNSESFFKIIDFYCRLSFTKGNDLTKLLLYNNIGFKNIPETTVELKPSILPLMALYKLILINNPSIDSAKAKEILEDFLIYKGWRDRVDLL